MTHWLRRVLAWLGVLVLLAAVVWGGWRVSGLLAAPSSEEDDVPVRVTAEVERRTLEEIVVTRGTVGFPEAGSVEIGAPGRVTAVAVSSGDMLDTNQVVISLDGRPVVTMDGVAPFWRDLSAGQQGEDVAALQTFLSSHGYLTWEPDGRFGPSTEAAVEDWQEEHGMSDPDGELRLGDTVVGEWPARVGQIAVDAGDFLNQGDVIGTLTSDTAAVSLELLPSERLRVVEGSEVLIEVAATGQQASGVVGRVSLDPVDSEGSPLYPAAVEVTEDLDIPDGTQVRLTIVIQRAEDVLAVPVAAVVSGSSGEPVVRVVGADDAIETTPVELGLSEGAWVEVSAGLSGGESVVVAESAAADE